MMTSSFRFIGQTLGCAATVLCFSVMVEQPQAQAFGVSLGGTTTITVDQGVTIKSENDVTTANPASHVLPTSTTSAASEQTANLGGLIVEGAEVVQASLGESISGSADACISIGHGNDCSNSAAVPEPTTMAGIALAGSGLAFYKRRFQQKNAPKQS